MGGSYFYRKYEEVRSECLQILLLTELVTMNMV